MSRQVVVTGGCGFIGRVVAKRLAVQGEHVTIIDPAAATSTAARPWAALRDVGVRIVADRIEDAPLVDASVVIHLAAPVGGLGVTRSWPVAGRIVSATRAAISVARHSDAPLVNVSSSEVYGVGGAYTEETRCVTPGRHSPRLGYAVGKLAAEQDAHTAGLVGVVSVRPFNVVGPGQSAAAGFVLPRFIDQALRGSALTVFGDGQQTRALLSVYDCASAIIAAARGLVDEPRDLGIVNVGNPANRTSMLDLAHLVAEVVEGHVGWRAALRFTTGDVEYDEPRYEEAEGGSKEPANIDKARSTLGWAPAWGLRRIVEDAVGEAVRTAR